MKEYFILLFIVIIGVLIADAIEGFIRITWFRGGIDAGVPSLPLTQLSKKNEPFDGIEKKKKKKTEKNEEEEIEQKDETKN